MSILYIISYLGTLAIGFRLGVKYQQKQNCNYQNNRNNSYRK